MYFARKTQNLGKSQAYLDIFFHISYLYQAPKTILAVIIQSHDGIHEQK